MVELIDFVIVFVSTLVSLVVLGVIAGFSPTLYIAQVAVASKTKALSYSIALMCGVVAAIILLIVLFQVIHLDTLLSFIDTTVRALTVSVIFNILIGVALIYGGFHYLYNRDLQKNKNEKVKLKKASGFTGLAGLGFVRTFLSVTGVTATYIAGNVIADVSVGLAERLVYTLIFLVVTIIPFAVIMILINKNPARLNAITEATRTLLERLNYRLVAGVAAIIFGSSIVIFNIMIALFY